MKQIVNVQMDNNELAAGRKLDALIAEHILKFDVEKFMSLPPQPTGLYATSKDPLTLREIPHFSTNIVDAFEIWLKLAPNGPILHDGRVYLSWRAFDDGIEIEAESVPHAICLAALKIYKILT